MPRRKRLERKFKEKTFNENELNGNTIYENLLERKYAKNTLNGKDSNHGPMAKGSVLLSVLTDTTKPNLFPEGRARTETCKNNFVRKLT